MYNFQLFISKLINFTLLYKSEIILQVDPEFWDVKTGKVKGRAAEANNINRQLDNLKSTIDKAYTKQIDELGYALPEKINNIILGIDQKNKTLLEFFDMHNKQYAMKVGY